MSPTAAAATKTTKSLTVSSENLPIPKPSPDIATIFNVIRSFLFNIEKIHALFSYILIIIHFF